MKKTALLLIPVLSSVAYGAGLRIMDPIQFNVQNGKVVSAEVQSFSSAYRAGTGVTLEIDKGNGPSIPNLLNINLLEVGIGAGARNGGASTSLSVDVDPTVQQISDACAGNVTYQNLNLSLIQGDTRVPLGTALVSTASMDQVLAWRNCQNLNPLISRIFPAELSGAGVVEAQADPSTLNLKADPVQTKPCASKLVFGGDGQFHFRWVTGFSLQQNIHFSSASASIQGDLVSEVGGFTGDNAMQECQAELNRETSN